MGEYSASPLARSPLSPLTTRGPLRRTDYSSTGGLAVGWAVGCRPCVLSDRLRGRHVLHHLRPTMGKMPVSLFWQVELPFLVSGSCLRAVSRVPSEPRGLSLSLLEVVRAVPGEGEGGGG